MGVLTGSFARGREKVREVGPAKAGRALIRKLTFDLRPSIVPLPPIQLTLEVTGRCNYSCVMCGRFRSRYMDKSHYQDMPEDLFLEIIGSLPDLQDLWIWGIGEPTLHPELPRFLSFAARRVPWIHCFTNGSRLLDRSLQGRIAESGLYELLVSLETADPEIHESIRIGSDFEKVTEGIAQFAALKRERNLTRPILTVTTLVMRRTIGRLRELMRFVKELGADKIQIIRLCPAPDMSSLIHECLIPEEEEDLQSLDTYAVELGLDINLPPRYKKRPVSGCNQVWAAPYVAVNGDVSPCPLNYYVHGIRMGNVYEQPLMRIWNGPEYRKHRRLVKSGRSLLCSGCAFAGPIWRPTSASALSKERDVARDQTAPL